MTTRKTTAEKKYGHYLNMQIFRVFSMRERSVAFVWSYKLFANWWKWTFLRYTITEHARSDLYFSSAAVELWFKGLIYWPRWLWAGLCSLGCMCCSLRVSSHPQLRLPRLLGKWIHEGKTILEKGCAFSEGFKGGIPLRSWNGYLEKPLVS